MYPLTAEGFQTATSMNWGGVYSLGMLGAKGTCGPAPWKETKGGFYIALRGRFFLRLSSEAVCGSHRQTRARGEPSKDLGFGDCASQKTISPFPSDAP